ncbi:MAG: 1-(5-phosphoribosyl)-5-[(5-phosphoribosylamino)methylideneamino]imidazole-4-carboxamide isomerase [Bacteroidia bacterium]
MIAIIPAIDLIDGKCVRLTQGDYAQKTIYNKNPLEVAKQFENIGIERLHLVDLDGARNGKVINQSVLETIASQTKLLIDFGGGIKTDEDIASVFNSGAAMATIGSIAVKDPELFYSWITKYGSSKLLLGADVNNEQLAISGWQEKTDISIFDFIQQNLQKGIKQLFCTDISKDGLLQGPSLELYQKITAEFPQLHLIASGGVSKTDDIDALEKAGCSGVIIGKAIYENRISLEDIKSYIKSMR